MKFYLIILVLTSFATLAFLSLGFFKVIPLPLNEVPKEDKLQEPKIKASKKELVFVEDAQNNEVIVLTTQGEIIKRIKVGKEPHDIAVSPNKKWVATGNFKDGTVSIINTFTLALERNLKTGEGAHGVAFDLKGRFLFVANAREDTLSVIDIENLEEGQIKQEKIKIGGFPEYVGVTKDNSKIFTTNLAGQGFVTVLENKGFDSKIIKNIDLGIDPHGWAISPDGSKIVITNIGSNFTYIVDSDTFEEIAHIDTGSETEFAAFRSKEELWVTNIGSNYITIINPEENKIVSKIEVGKTPHGISFSADKKFAFVPLYRPGEVVIIDAQKRKVAKKVKVGEKLHNLVVIKLSAET